MLNLTQKHVFIAGGSRGIGRATALLAAQAGADVSINYVSRPDAAAEVVREIEQLGRKAMAVQADVSVAGEADRAIGAAVATLGPLWGVAISAGIFEGSPIMEMTPEFWDRTMNINLRGTFLVVQASARHLISQGKGGSVVIFTSTAGQRGSSVFSAYATSKGAQILFMRSMAKELAIHKIRVNCVAPGWTETDMSREAMDKEGREAIIQSIPLGRIGQAQDPARAALFLLSDFSSFITGSSITVDGGFDMRG